MEQLFLAFLWQQKQIFGISIQIEMNEKAKITSFERYKSSKFAQIVDFEIMQVNFLSMGFARDAKHKKNYKHSHTCGHDDVQQSTLIYFQLPTSNLF